jgi:multiple sugar transport system substrate-binding protein
VTIRWFIGLGGSPGEIDRMHVFVDKFNSEQEGKYLLLPEVYSNTVVRDTLLKQIASGDSPDIVGPVDITSVTTLKNVWMDLTGPMTASGYDLSDFPPSVIEILRSQDGGQMALPIAAMPLALFYNKALFDAAHLPYPPSNWEGTYQGGEWTYEALREIAMQMTIDENGATAAEPAYRPDKARQFGFFPQWSEDIRWHWTLFGAASLRGNDGRANIPAVWRRAADWLYQGMWTDHFIPTMSDREKNPEINDSAFIGGRLAMMPQNYWYYGCFNPEKPIDWDVAAMPSFKGGRPVSRIHINSLAIPKGAADPQASFDVLSLLLGKYAFDLFEMTHTVEGWENFSSEPFYMALPTRMSLQAAAIEHNRLAFPDVDYQVFLDALNYSDIPSHQEAPPNPQQSHNVLVDFQSRYESTPGLDLDRELDQLEERLQEAFDEAAPLR